MSFSRVFTRKALPLTRTRLFTTSPCFQKTATEETIQKVNKTVSEPLVKGIEKAEQAAQSLKSSTGMGAKKADGTAAEMTGDAKGTAKDIAGQAKGKAQEMSGEAKGKANEMSGQDMAGQAKGKAQEMAGEAKGKMSEVSGQAKGKTEEIKSKM